MDGQGFLHSPASADSFVPLVSDMLATHIIAGTFCSLRAHP